MIPRPPGSARPREGIFAGEQGFALLLVGPGLATLILTTTFPLAYLIWSSFQNINLAMPFLDGFVGLENYQTILGDGRVALIIDVPALSAISGVRSGAELQEVA